MGGATPTPTRPRGASATRAGNVAPHGSSRHHHRALMAGRCAIGLVLLDRGNAADAARGKLAAALPGADVSDPDDVGVFEVTLDAESQDDALCRVWDGVA